MDVLGLSTASYCGVYNCAIGGPMGLRFRKTFKLAPGVRMNLGSGGTSFNFGPRGASISIGKRGLFANTSVLGFSSRTNLSSSQTRSRPIATSDLSAKTVQTDVIVGVTDEGELYFRDPSGRPVPEAWIEAAKKQQAEAIRTLIKTKCDEINAQIEAVGELHRYTPSPETRPVFTAQEYTLPPKAPEPKRIDFWAKILRFRRRRIEAENAESALQHAQQVELWNRGLVTHREAETRRKRLIEHDIYSDIDAMEMYLEIALQDIAWPRETLVAIEVTNEGREIYLDVDLPELEDMPSNIASVPQRGLKLSIKEMSVTQVQRLYMRHVHAIGFRILGETFASLPMAQLVVLSGYSQRRSRGTGQIAEEYLYSVRVEREAWAKIDFSESGLAAIDVVEALGQFDLRRTMTKSGVFKPITPHAQKA